MYLLAQLAIALGLATGPPAHVSPHVTNPWFPLRAGTVLRYEGTDEGVRVKEVLSVSRKTRAVAGGRARVIHDRIFKRGHVVEDTLDWYGQDDAGNVWYFGEATKELNARGRVISREGSWEAGKNGARAGIFMPAHPRVGRSYRQEYYKGHAEDHFKIVSIRGNRLVTHEWTPLEPGVLDQKIYVRGIGTTSEDSLKGGSEHLHLVERRRS